MRNGHFFATERTLAFGLYNYQLTTYVAKGGAELVAPDNLLHISLVVLGGSRPELVAQVALVLPAEQLAPLIPRGLHHVVFDRVRRSTQLPYHRHAKSQVRSLWAVACGSGPARNC